MYLINYRECELFCDRLTQLLSDLLPEGYKFRIPTEAQWEYAARGGNMSKNYMFSGSNTIDEVAWYDANSEETTHEAGKKIKNELGIYDMSGNVWEWCRDRYSENYYSNSPSVNPKGPVQGTQYVLRGGSWAQNELGCRTATRIKDAPVAYTTNYGFRLVLEPPAKLTGTGFFGYTGKFTASRLSSGKNLTFKLKEQKFEMIFVEGGTFTIGCNSEDKSCDSIKKPARNVKLSNYYMGKYEITQKLWNSIMGTNVRQQRDLVNANWEIYGEGAHYPMYYVNYEECETFCEKLNELLYTQLPENYKFILPTEAQWEYAARGGSKSKGYTYSGSNKISKVAWWEGNSGNKSREVGLKSKNELGIYDMSGNVWEWCRDWFKADYYSYGSTTNPQGALSGTHRVLRGGGWNLKEWHSRTTNRSYYEPEARSANLGFRIALEPAKDLFDLKSLKDAINKLASRFSSKNSRSFKIDNLDFEMVFVEGGTFTMGCTSNPDDCLYNEEPTHSVTLSDFYMGKFEVTQQLWTKVMGTTLQQQSDLNIANYGIYGEGDYYPMYYINYKDCEEFCEKLNGLLSKQLPEGYKFSLPTEAQWEYAARGGKKSKGYTYSGDDNIKKVAWFEENSKGRTHEIGTKKKNELGIYDMSGNLWEWCKDYFHADYYSNSPSVNPTGPAIGNMRVVRGGSWQSIAQACRVSCCSISPPNERAPNFGFRLALVKEEKP
jgi:formylglycine-generating enzyme required for sulfatase activity